MQLSLKDDKQVIIQPQLISLISHNNIIGYLIWFGVYVYVAVRFCQILQLHGMVWHISLEACQIDLRFKHFLELHFHAVDSICCFPL